MAMWNQKTSDLKLQLSLSGLRVGLGAAALAVAFMANGGAAHAQSDPDFIDPLEEVRESLSAPRTQGSWAAEIDKAPAEIERSPIPKQRGVEFSEDPLFRAGNDLRNAATGSAARAESAASTAWDSLRASLSGLAAKFGVSLWGLLAGLAALFALLALLMGWALFGGRRKKTRKGGVYSRSGSRERRRIAGAEQPERRQRARMTDDATADERLPLRSSAQEPDQYAMVQDAPDFTDGADSSGAEDAPTRDPSTWRRPKLDRLRESIRADWRASKKAPKAAPLDDGEDFDALLEQENARHESAADEHRDDALDTLLRPEPTQHPADLPLTQVASDWNDWDDGLEDDADVFGQNRTKAQPEEAPVATEDEALRRVRALREALRAS